MMAQSTSLDVASIGEGARRELEHCSPASYPGLVEDTVDDSSSKNLGLGRCVMKISILAEQIPVESYCT
jgi:hypothetical protein